MMKENQLAYMSRACGIDSHINSAVAKAMFALLIVLNGILSIVNEQVRAFNEGKEILIAAILPFYIGSVDHVPSSIIYTIDDCTIQRMAACEPGSHVYICWAQPWCSMLVLIGDSRVGRVLMPGNAESIIHCMVGTLRW